MILHRFTLLLLVIVFLSTSALAVANVGIQDVQCVDGTGIQFKLTNAGDDIAFTKDMKLEAHYFSSFSLKVDDRGVDKNYKFPVTGDYNAENLHPKGDQLVPVTFTSASGIFPYPGTYKIYLTYKGCKETYGKCVAIDQVTCQGLPQYGCAALPLTVDSCENTQTQVVLKFHNVKRGLLQHVDPKKDLEFIFFGKAYHIQNDLPDDTAIKETSFDNYELTFNQIPDNYIDRVKLMSKICGYETYANCKFADDNGSDIPDIPTVQPYTDQNLTTTSASFFSNFDKLTYLVSLIFVIIIIFILYTVNKVRV